MYDGSILTQYFNNLGLYGSRPIYNTILITYHRYLNEDSIKLEDQIKKYQAIQKNEEEDYLARIDKDTLNGVYIPRDIQDCFFQLDKMLSIESRNEIKSLQSKEETIKYHLGFGMSLRNSWGLWSGSRLQKYFLDKKVEHPDWMSSIILKFYYDWLNNKNSDWMRWAR